MQLRILSGDDVRKAVDMSAAIDAMEMAFAALSAGEVTVPVRLSLETGHGVTLFMPAHLREEGLAGVKVASVNPGNTELKLPVIQAVVLALDPVTGSVLALMDGTWLTALRTGAIGGLAAKLLAREDASVVALFGAGIQARTQLEAVRCVRPVTEVRIVSKSGTSADQLAKELVGVHATRFDDPGQAINGADIVIASTSSSTPVFDGSQIAPGTHVTGVGSFTPEMREVDTALVSRARVIVDQRQAVLEEAGDIIGPITDGDLDESAISAEIGEIVLGSVQGRMSAEEITFFKSVGNAVQDVTVAALVLEQAEIAGLGVTVRL